MEIFLILASMVVCGKVFVKARPEFINIETTKTVSETASIGTVLMSLTAKDADNPTSKLDISPNTVETEKLVNITNYVYLNDTVPGLVVDVLLAVKLDSDYEPTTRYLYFKATDGGVQVGTTPTITLVIIDEHDTHPTFENLPYIIDTAENTLIDTVIYKDVTARDPDSGAFLIYSLQTLNVPFNISQYTGEINLIKTLDYESLNAYRLEITVIDNVGFNDTANVDIRITDIQDTPPYFLNAPYRADVLENLPKDSSVAQVSALDGDRGVLNSIKYTFSEGDHEYFSIEEQTGIIRITKVIDRDAEFMVAAGGVFTIDITAEENNDTFPQTGNTTASSHIIIRIEDENDEIPTFDKISTPYTAIVRSDVPNGTLISFEDNGYIHVYDRDQDLNSKVSVDIEKDGAPCEFLEATPSEIYSEGFILFRITDSQHFNKSQNTVQETFKVIARETSTKEMYSSEAIVVITIELAVEVVTPTATTISDKIGASDIVIFVVCSLLLINFIATLASCYYIFRNRKKYGFGMRRLNEYFYTPNTGQAVSDENKDNQSETGMSDTTRGLEFYNSVSIPPSERRNTTTSETPSALISTDVVPMDQSPTENTAF